jgi:hypothetical protein
MKPIIDPRAGDIEDDASSTKSRSLLSLAGSLLGEINLPKLILAWTLLVVLPALALGLAPVVAAAWLQTVWGKILAPFARLWTMAALAAVLALGWFAGGALFRLAESSFWSLNSLTVAPGYATCREALRHLAERLLPAHASQAQVDRLRALTAALAGVLVSCVGLAVLAIAWPHSQWAARWQDLTYLPRLARIGIANSVVLVGAYLAAAALIWGIDDASMAQPHDVERFPVRFAGERVWRIAHLSDVHVVGERYGFRIESGRSGPRGNERWLKVLEALDAICEDEALDTVLLTGDATDAGRSTEWAEFFDALGRYPRVAERLLLLPGNHDLNIVDRANPARLDLPTSPNPLLRQLRTLSAMEAMQGHRVRVVDRKRRCLGFTLSEALAPHQAAMAEFADSRPRRLSRELKALWAGVFPMVQPPPYRDGLGILLLNSNADTHFSFTNALGMVAVEQLRGVEIAMAEYPRASWLIALHHHLVEYPGRTEEFSERIGTALINGNWLIRRMQPLAGRAIFLHGHRHIDWIGECAGLPIVSAPSPVMECGGIPYFYIHSLAAGAGGLALLAPERVALHGEPVSRVPLLQG